MFDGPVDPQVYERVAQMLQRAEEATFMAKSKGLEITVMPGEGDEVLMVFDERASTNYWRAIAAFVFFSFAAVGAAEDGVPIWALFMLVCGVLLTSAAVYSAKQKSKDVQTERNELFATTQDWTKRAREPLQDL